MQASSSGNQVQFVLDGDAYFQQLSAMLAAVAAAPASEETYVRMAYWWVSPSCHLGGPGGQGQTIVEALQAVAARGHRVELIVWLPNTLDVTLEGLAAAEGAASAMVPRPGSETAQQDEGMLGGIVKDHEALEQAFASSDQVTVYLEKYDGWWGASNHQKFTVTAIAGELTVLLGGLNLSDGYYAAADHDASVWHDTAIVLKGPGAVDVEAEFVRRWNKGYTQAPVVRSQVPLVGAALKALVARFVGTVTAAVDDQPVEADDPVDLTVCTTNSEAWFGREVDIQSRLVACIAAARSSIYMENYGLYDPTLVQALHDRLRKPRAPQLIVMIPPPDDSVFGYLNYVSYLKVALAQATSITTPAGVIRRQDCKLWALADQADSWTTMRAITSTFSNRWMQEDALLVQGHRDAQPTVVRLDTISDVQSPLSFYCATNQEALAAGSPTADIYVHSKLALFDDQVAAVGSANFTFRSQTYDGEIMAFLSGASDAVSDIRQQLFAAWNMRDVAHWDEDVAHPRGAAGTTRVRALRMQDFPARSVEAVEFGGLEGLNFTLL